MSRHAFFEEPDEVLWELMDDRDMGEPSLRRGAPVFPVGTKPCSEPGCIGWCRPPYTKCYYHNKLAPR